MKGEQAMWKEILTVVVTLISIIVSHHNSKSDYE